MKRNLVGKILGKIKIFGQEFVPIRTALSMGNFHTSILGKRSMSGAHTSLYFYNAITTWFFSGRGVILYHPSIDLKALVIGIRNYSHGPS